jgi:hypothetical protein
MGKTHSQMLAFGERRTTILTIHAAPIWFANLLEQTVGVTIVGFTEVEQQTVLSW